MTIERLEEIESDTLDVDLASVSSFRLVAVEFIREVRRLRGELNAIQKAAREAQDG